MTNNWIEILLYCTIVIVIVKPLGWYMTRVFAGQRTFLSPILRPLEIGLYRLGGVDEKSEQSWRAYTIAMLLFHVGGFIALYALLRVQESLPLNRGGGAARSVLQYGGELSHQYELAELCR